jgi:hypothetical protein
MKIILHIGPHKTGTSALQVFLHSHAATLSRHGIHYPALGGEERNHHAIVFGLRTPSLFGATVDRLRRIVSQAGSTEHRACIFSSEMFVEHEVPIEAIRDIFVGCEVQVLAYLRRPDHLWASAYAQLVKEVEARRTQRIDEDPPPYDCSYSTVLLKWMEHFAPGQMVLAPFDPPQWPGGNLFQDFLRMVGLDQVFPAMRAPSGIESNQSLPATLLEALRVSNASGRLSGDRHRLLVGRLEALAQEFPTAFGPPARLPTVELVRRSFKMLQPHLEVYRRYYRAGFDESFLRWPGEDAP